MLYIIFKLYSDISMKVSDMYCRFLNIYKATAIFFPVENLTDDY